MIDAVLYWGTFLAALGSGLIAGVFFAFSTFVMRALGRLPAAQGIAAMQSINVTAISPIFMIALFGTAAVCAVLLALALQRLQMLAALCIAGGSALYIGGTVVVTIVCNVPRNNALARVNATSAEGEAIWRRYLSEWTAWNHIRTISAAAGAGLLTFALTKLV